MRKTFQKWLFIFVFTAFIITLFISFSIQTQQAEENALHLINLKIEDAKEQIAQNDNNLALVTAINNAEAIDKAHALSQILENKKITTEMLEELLKSISVDEINVVDGDGIIVCTTKKEYLGFDMRSTKQSGEFIVILSDRTKEVIQQPQRVGYDNTTIMQYAAVSRLDAPGFIQIGYVPERLYKAQEVADIEKLASGFRIGTNGKIIVCKNNEIVSSNDDGYLHQSITKLGLSEDSLRNGYIITNIDDVEYICNADSFGDYTIIGLLPTSEMYINRNAMVAFLLICNIILFIVVFILVSQLVQKVVIDGIYNVNDSLQKITAGNLDEEVKVNNNEEFASLSHGINSTVAALKQAISDAAARIDAELEFAKAIQTSSLPNVFPPYPERDEFDIYAAMYTAKEVGGDFYDFYLLDADHLVIVIADVSGKGVPAALFMMTTKTLIKSLAESGMEPSRVLTEANAQLCENNDAGMFVTVWLGVLEISTGKLTYANAGHNPPLLLQNGQYNYLTSRSGFVLAGMEGVKYRQNEIVLVPGDAVFLYTDGVTEATDAADELYGEDRLQQVMIDNAESSATDTISHVKDAVDAFVQDAPQFDDITMLCLRYNGDRMQRLELATEQENMEAAIAFVGVIMENNNVPLKICTQINIVLDEILSNIISYSGSSRMILECGIKNAEVILRFIDDGKPYNPLEKADPDITLSAENRELGGLGIFMVKKSMDEMTYEYSNNQNRLTVTKKLQQDQAGSC